MALRGMSTVLGNVSRQMAKVKVKGQGALARAALLVKRKSMELCPVGDTGNLVNSHETEVVPSGLSLKAEIRVTADYAIYVHEMPETYHFRKPGSGPKFLERALYENQKAIFDILAKEGRI